MISINTILLSFLLGLSAQSGQSVAKLNTFEQSETNVLLNNLQNIFDFLPPKLCFFVPK